jgi:Gas vesicle synthesis protein GvpL/GvpF
VIELYAITDDATPPDPPLRAVRSDGLTALYAPSEPHEATIDELRRHEAVVEALMESRDLLPVRFGTLLADERAAARAVAERSEELAASLDRVRGAVELAVRVHARRPDADPPPRGVSGRDYMSGKARKTEAARAMHEPFAQAARESVIRPGPELLRAAYLVDRSALDRFVALVRRLQDANPELDVLCTGPWPPYSFADGGRSS